SSTISSSSVLVPMSITAVATPLYSVASQLPAHSPMKILASFTSRPARPLETELLGDDDLHDLVGAGEDPADPRIHECARHRVLQHVSIAAEELQAGVGDLLRHVGGPELGDRALLDQVLAGDVAGDHLIDVGAADLDLGEALYQLELRVLELADRLAERLA